MDHSLQAGDDGLHCHIVLTSHLWTAQIWRTITIFKVATSIVSQWDAIAEGKMQF